MSKLALHCILGRIEEGLRLNEDITYKSTIDSIRFIDTFYITFSRGKQSISFMGEV